MEATQEIVKHTQGEWRQSFNISNGWGVRTPAGYICFLPKPSHYSGQDKRYQEELEERQANAKLIAAAPDLLEALIKAEKEILANYELLNIHDSSVELILKIRAAINKATL